MDPKVENQKWMEDYSDFLSGPQLNPPAFVSDGIQNFVARELKPSLWTIMSHLTLVHIAAGTVSLLICSQFGIGRGHLLAHAFMSFGETVCLALCGALFMGVSFLSASLWLTPNELKGIRKSAYAPVLALGILTLSAFFCLGADIGLRLGTAWLVGALIAGVLATEVGIQLRSARMHFAS